MTKPFHSIARAITSMDLVTFVLMVYITGMLVCSHTQFVSVFPDSMTAWGKDVAGWTIAFVFEVTVLITISNPQFINKHIPWLMAIASGLTMLFFVQAFDFTVGPLQIAQRWFMGILTATMGYTFSHLFYKKWCYENDLLKQPAQVQQLTAQVQQQAADLQQAAAGRQQDAATIQQLRAEVKELAAFRTKTEKELTCPSCKQLQPAYSTLRSHVGHCRKKNLVALNGG